LRDAAYVGALLGIPRKSVLQYAREGTCPQCASAAMCGS